MDRDNRLILPADVKALALSLIVVALFALTSHLTIRDQIADFDRLCQRDGRVYDEEKAECVPGKGVITSQQSEMKK